MKLEFPEEKHRNAYEKLMKEWSKKEIISDISPYSISRWHNFDNFLKEVEDYLNNKEKDVNSSTFFLIENNEILWVIDIRHHINHKNLIEKWWHIWYWIAPEFRRKWYATKMLELWLIEARKIWLEKVLITCNISNIGSKKVIEKNWGIFERLTNDWTMNRFWIKL